MKTNLVQTGLCLLLCSTATGAVRYVNLNNPAPAAPFTSWATAATRIQDAIDAATAGDEIVVTNGVYATGGRAVHGTMTNRVAVDKPLTLRSVNGPQVTVIQGYQVPGTTNGDGAIRCAYLTNSAILSGFTLTNGATRATNDYSMYRESGGGGVHCEALQSYQDPPTVVSNCVITGNSAFGPGGGAYGGGVGSAQIIGCELRGNTAQVGGGMAEGWAKRCLIVNNSAVAGGGASEAGGEAGGFEYYSCKLDNCLLVGNRAQYDGGGAYCCELNNCTVVGNYAGQAGGGVYGLVVIQVQHPSRAVNSVVYSNTAPSDENFISYACNFENSCTAPLPTWGSGNITNTPSFVDFAGGDFRLQSDSPCINTGTNYYAPGPLDLDGNPRIRGGTVDMGAFEFQQGSTGIVHYVNLLNTNPVSPYISWAAAATNIQDAIDAAVAGDEIVVTNGTYATGGRVAQGLTTNRVAVTKALSLRSVNGPQFTVIQGRQVPGTTNGAGAIRCIYLTKGAVLTGFTLTNGATRNYESGGGAYCETNVILSNCVLQNNSADYPGGGAYWGALRDCSITGNSAADGGGAYGSTLINSLVRNNSAVTSGGGLYYCVASNCSLVGNSAYFGGGAAVSTLSHSTLAGNIASHWGGGAFVANLTNCLLAGNSASNQAGGGYVSHIANCTIVSNTAAFAGGVAIDTNGTAHNCIIYFNTATGGADNYFAYYGAALKHSCTTPLPTGSGNMADDPLFADLALGNFRLQSNSPGINAGNNLLVVGNTDLDGNPRIVGSAVDMGAYEFQSTQPTLKIMQSGMNIVLLWPLWAGDFDLQQTVVFPPGPNDWSDVAASPAITNSQNTVPLPIAVEPKMFRLFKPQ